MNPDEGNKITSTNPLCSFTGINSGTVNLGSPIVRFTAIDREAFLALTQSLPKGPVELQLNDPKNGEYAVSLLRLLIEAGYELDAKTIKTYFELPPKPFPPCGICFGVLAVEGMPDHARPLVAAFHQLGIPAGFRVDSKAKPGNVIVMITAPYAQ